MRKKYVMVFFVKIIKNTVFNWLIWQHNGVNECEKMLKKVIQDVGGFFEINAAWADTEWDLWA